MGQSLQFQNEDSGATPTSQTDLRDELKQLQAKIDGLMEAVAKAGNEQPAIAEGNERAMRARAIQKLRHKRARIFGDDLFAEPAWDMLLDLYASGLSGRRPTTTELCDASSVPDTTALRWITTLEDGQWIIRQRDPTDKRRVFLSLSKKGQAAMDEFFSQPELENVLQ